MTIALTRAVSPALAQCELTHIDRVSIDVNRARLQHCEYENALRRLGVEVKALEAEPELPDSVFVEDTAVVLDELAVMTRPGAVSRRAEVQTIAQALAPYRKLAWVPEPATIDGGDVLRFGKTLYVGLSTRSNEACIGALRALVQPFGYRVQGVALSGCLHLKTAVTAISGERLLINPNWVNPGDFGSAAFVEVHPNEPFGANALLIGEAVIYPTTFPRTLERVAQFVKTIECVDVSELAKAEGAVTCCSLVLE